MWLKSIDKNLKSQHQHFWKYISNFRKHRSGSIQVEVDHRDLVQPKAVADDFSKHFQSVYNTTALSTFPHSYNLMKFCPLHHIFDADVCKAIKKLKLSKSTGLGDIPGFIIKGCSVIFSPILRHIFNLSVTQQYYPSAWKVSAIVPVLKRGSYGAVCNYRPISILSNFYKLFQLIVHDHVSLYQI
jgi:hypothetical protein